MNRRRLYEWDYGFQIDEKKIVDKLKEKGYPIEHKVVILPCAYVKIDSEVKSLITALRLDFNYDVKEFK